MTDNKDSSHLRILKIVEIISLADSPPSPSDIAYELGIPKPTVHRMIAQLKAERYIQTNPRGNLVPDTNLNKISFGIIQGSRYKIIRQSILLQLSTQLHETCGIAVTDGIDIVHYDVFETHNPLRIHLPKGSRVPLYATASGKLYMSRLTKSKRQKVLSHLPLEPLAANTITDIDKFEHEFKDIRRQGYAIDNEEYIDNLIAIAVPIIDQNNAMTSSLFMHAPTTRMSVENLKEIAPLLKEKAADLSAIYEQH